MKKDDTQADVCGNCATPESDHGESGNYLAEKLLGCPGFTPSAPQPAEDDEAEVYLKCTKCSRSVKTKWDKELHAKVCKAPLTIIFPSANPETPAPQADSREKAIEAAQKWNLSEGSSVKYYPRMDNSQEAERLADFALAANRTLLRELREKVDQFEKHDVEKGEHWIDVIPKADVLALLDSVERGN